MFQTPRRERMRITMTKRIQIEGMSCEHCAMRVKKMLESLDGVSSAEVSLADKSAVVTLETDVPDRQLRDMVYDAGYDVTAITAQ